ncbi:predicted protein [Naegleria gruberi]|uniref:Predicted protein n=1 Tax=Naegleria gruberi TaxID=5762 RepID=D2V1A9_NAEGR|nr:uncharacterized protein NAEGRDRAFT_62821 [Naegleria gruberi]EFC49438.1 predicted protein [Naegleria gruberi]|eukprot:XP_002682182.1 predicted protein [Naegleria gruberi strain NEG-M]
MLDKLEQIKELARKDPIRFILLMTLIVSIVVFTYILTEFFRQYGLENTETIRSCEMILSSLNEHRCTAYDCEIAKREFNFVTPIHLKSLYYQNSETIITPVYSREESDRRTIPKSAETCSIGGSCYSPAWLVSMVNTPSDGVLYSGVVTTSFSLANEVLASMQPLTKYYCFLNNFNDLTMVPPNVTYIPRKVFIVMMLNGGFIVMSFIALKVLGLVRRVINKMKKNKNGNQELEDDEIKPINESE